MYMYIYNTHIYIHIYIYIYRHTLKSYQTKNAKNQLDLKDINILEGKDLRESYVVTEIVIGTLKC